MLLGGKMLFSLSFSLEVQAERTNSLGFLTLFGGISLSSINFFEYLRNRSPKMRRTEIGWMLHSFKYSDKQKITVSQKSEVVEIKSSY